MKHPGLLALSACLSAVVASNHMAHQHLHKRDLVTTTVWEDVTETINVIVTVYGPSPGDASAPATTSTQTTPAQLPVEQEKAADVVAPPSITPSVTPPASVTPPSQAPASTPPTVQQNQAAAPQVQAAAPQVQAAAPQAQAPQQPAAGDSSSGGSSGGSQPSGGACGTTGGKCTAEKMTIYNDQGLGSCGWTNDTNSQDFFALAEGKCTCCSFVFTSSTPASFWVYRVANYSLRYIRHLQQRRSPKSQERILRENGDHILQWQANTWHVDG